MIGPSMNHPLIEGSLSSFVAAIAPPPWKLDRGVHFRMPSAAGEHRNAWPPKKEKEALI
jgi:hypothetical protein